MYIVLYMYSVQAHSLQLHAYARMKIGSKFLSFFKLDHSYSLLNCRNVSVLLEFFKALDIRGMMALDGITLAS